MSEPQTPLEQVVSETHPENRLWSGFARKFSEPNLADWIIAAFTIVIGVVGIFQWRAISGQWGEMKAAGQQTDKLICLYQQQLAALQQQATDTHDLAVQAGKQADAARASATTTLRMFEANRPVVVLDTADLVLNPAVRGLAYRMVLINDGGLAAMHLVDGCDEYIDNKFVPPDATNIVMEPVTMGPQDTAQVCEGILEGPQVQELQNLQKTLIIVVYAAYTGPAGSYKYCDKEKYVPSAKGFANIGECNDWKHPFK